MSGVPLLVERPEEMLYPMNDAVNTRQEKHQTF